MPLRSLAAALALGALASCHLPRPPPPIRDDAQAAVVMMYGYCADADGSAPMSRHMRSAPQTASAGDASWLADARQRLGVDSEQAGAWTAYATAAQADAEAMSAMHERMMTVPDVSAPDRLQIRVEAMSARLASLERLLAAERLLYGALTPAQRTAADSILERHCGPMFN